MEIRDYGTTGAKATALGLGGAFLTHRSFADGVATVRKALDLGITYFDTSPMYCSGASQAVLGEAPDGVDGDFLLATKLGYFTEPSRFHSREALITQFEENLRLLRRDHVDTLQLHEADMHHWWCDDAASSDRILSERDYSFDDAPALAASRVGIALGSQASDTALETADVVVMTPQLSRLAQFLRIARRTRRLLSQNIVLALAIKLGVLVLAMAGLATMWMAVAADVGASMLVICNGMRLLSGERG